MSRARSTSAGSRRTSSPPTAPARPPIRTLPPFTIIQPPPNITGSLHLGPRPADRGRGPDDPPRPDARPPRRSSCPGLDHASIAAQFVLDGILAKEGESRADRSAASATSSGCAPSWPTTREVMLGQQRRVGGVVRLGPPALHDGRGLGQGRPGRLRAPLPRRTSPTGPRRSSTGARAAGRASATSRSSRTPETGTLWSVRYHLIDPATGEPSPDETITVATTRPETILGDTAVAVHPDDPRYAALVGRPVRIPFVERDVPIIADDVVDPAFGTGARQDHAGPRPRRPRDRPAPRPRRHRRSWPTTRRSPATGTRYDGLDRYEARAAIVADLEARGRPRRRAAPHEMVIGRCQRSNDVIEPRLKTQWFIRTTPLAERALEATRSGRTRILPERFEKTWEHWLTNIRDWNVSRQLWWGHRIPAWYCPDGHVTVSSERGRSGRLRRLRPARRRAPAGPRHLRHVVQLGAVAVLDARLAGRHARSTAPTTRPRSWRPATTSSSSGSPG